MSRIDTEIAMLHRELDRAIDRIVDLEWENDGLRRQLAIYEWKATIEAWDEAWMREHQLQLPFEESYASTQMPDVLSLPFMPEEI